MPPAIVLCGGLGTRLRGVVNDLPKPLAPVNGIPFLDYLLRYLSRQGVNKVVLAIGYKGDLIKKQYGECFNGMEIRYSHETTPLGTGGAVKLAISSHRLPLPAFVLNGDTYFDIPLDQLLSRHSDAGMPATLALKPMSKAARYGSVELSDGKVVGFKEKACMENALINGGVYCVGEALVERLPAKDTFSWEKDVLETLAADRSIAGYVHDGYFIDIGIPKDYSQAQTDFKVLFA